MPRSAVTTRAATVADVPVLTALLAELRQVGGRAERAMSPVIGPADALLAGLIASPDSEVVLACIDEDPAGMAVMRRVRPDPLSETELVQLAHLVVRSSLRHRGVGHALVEAAAAYAMECHIEQLAVSVYPSLRDASRFYARLGFAPAATHRVAPLPLLRRRLGLERGAPSLSDGMRRRTRLLRPIPPQHRRGEREQV